MNDPTVSSSVLDSSAGPRRWLVLTHHLPPDPAYFRVKVRRRLNRIGAVALKNSVYVLPTSNEALEDFQWLVQEIVREGGEATLAEASFVDGQTDPRLIEQFRQAREADYRELTQAARTLLEEGRAGKSGMSGFTAKRQRLNQRLEEVIEVDYFEADGRSEAEFAVAALSAPNAAEGASVGRDRSPAMKNMGTGRSWVTREGVKVDRIASAWLISRFIDPQAQFRFVQAQSYQQAEGDLRFDMFEGEFSHEGDSCTFETLLEHFALTDPALRILSFIVHDIDCKDEKFGRPEVPGVASLINGIVRRYTADVDRMERGAVMFDDLYEHFRRPGP